MPAIPQYTSKDNVRTGPIAPQENLARQDAANQNKVLGALQQTAQAWSDAHDVMQYTKAKSDYEIAAADIKERATLDEDFNNTSQYLAELEKARAESIAGIDNKQVAGKASQEIGLSNTLNGIKIDYGFKQKELANNQFNVKNWVSSKVNEMGSATSAERLQISTDIEDNLNLQIQQGVLSPESANEILLKAKLESANTAIFQDPEQAIQELKSKDGVYSDLPGDKKRTLITSAEQYKKRLEKESEILKQDIKYKNEAELTKQLADGDIDALTVSEVSSMIGNGSISKDYGEAYIRVLTSPRSIGKTKKMKKSGFPEFATQLFKAETEEELEKSLINLFDATSSSDKMNQEELAVLLQSADKISKEGKGWISGLTNTIKDAWNMQPGVMAFNYLTKINEGKPHEQAKEETISEEQIRVNPERSQYSIGDTVDTPRGTMYVWGYYEDGEPDVRFEKPSKGIK